MQQTPRERGTDPPHWGAAGSRETANTVIGFADDVDGHAGVTVVCNSVLDDERLGSETRLVYVMLRRLAAAPSIGPLTRQELAGRIGISLERLSPHLATLEEAGLIWLEGPSSDRASVCYSFLPEVVADHGDRRAHPPAQQSRPLRARSARGRVGLDLVDRLIIMGVDPAIAGELLSNYPRERVAGALRAAHRRRPRPRDPAAWIVAAIQHDWVAPSAAAMTRQWEAAREEAISSYERCADQALAALPTATQQALRRQARQIVERRFDRRLATSTIGLMLIGAELRRLVAEHSGIPVPDP